MTKESVLAGLKSGRILMCDRRDEPLLPWLMSLVDAGQLNCELVEFDEQSSAMKFTWKPEA